MNKAPAENIVSSENKGDSFLECLAFLGKHFGKTKSPKSLVSGLPYDEKGMDAKLFCEAAKKNNIKAEIAKKTNLSKFSNAVMPCVLILKGNIPCVLIETKNNQAKIYDPKTKAVQEISLKQLSEKYTGYLIYVTPDKGSNAKEQQGDMTSCQSDHWYWSIVKKRKELYALVILASVFINLFALVSPLFIMNVYDRVIPNAAIETGWALGIGAIIAFIFDFAFRTIRGYLIDFASRNTDVIATRRIYDHVLDMRLSHKPLSSGAFANMLKDFDSVRDFFTSATITALVDLPFTVLFLFFVYQLGGYIALILIGIIALVVVMGMGIQYALKKLVFRSQKSAQSKHGLLLETIHGLETIKSLQSDGVFRKKYTQYSEEEAVSAQKTRMLSAFGVNSATFLQQITSVIIILNGMYLVNDNVLTVGGLIACVILGGRAISPIGQIANLITRYHQAGQSMRTLDEIMSAPLERPKERDFLSRSALSGHLKFQNVNFSYPQYNNVPVLRDVSFDMKAGEKVGIIGRVGSGKSTIAKLLLKLYEPDSGVIFADDTDLRQIDPADIRHNIAYIAQDVTLFQGSIRDNISISMPNASEKEILECATAAGVHDFVSAHPLGYDAPVGEGGDALSGGQRQAISLARAMLKQPDIIVCDEPTNAMDMQSENAFCKYIQSIGSDKTLLLITHKHSMLHLVDRLIVMHNGKIVMDAPRDVVIEALQSGQVRTEQG